MDFILSCRVFGRKIEETMVYTLIEYSREVGLKVLNAKFIPTPKNKPCLEFWQTRSGFVPQAEEAFTWDLNKSYSLPDSISLNVDEN